MLLIFCIVRIVTFTLYGYESKTRTIPKNIDLSYIFLNNSGYSLLAASYLAVLYSWHIIALKLKLSTNFNRELRTSKIIILVQIGLYAPISFGLSFAASFTNYYNPLMAAWALWISLFIFCNGIWSLRKILSIRSELSHLEENKNLIRMQTKNVFFGIAALLCLFASISFIVVIILCALMAPADPLTFLVWTALFRFLELIVTLDFFSYY